MMPGLKGFLINQPGAKPKQIRFDFRALSRCFTTVIRKPLKKDSLLRDVFWVGHATPIPTTDQSRETI